MSKRIASFVTSNGIVLDASMENKLLAVISTESPKQEKNDFKAFIDLIEKRAKESNITELTIFHTAWLHRHYIPLKDSKIQDSKIIEEIRTIQESWTEVNIDSLNTIFFDESGKIKEDSRDKSKKRNDKTLQEYIITDFGDKIKIKIISFEEILKKIQSPIYKEAREKVQRLYDQGGEFADLVNKHSKEYYGEKLFKENIGNNEDKNYRIFFKEKCENAAINYVLDECALVAIFDELRCTHLTYPGKVNLCFEFFQKIYSTIKSTGDNILKFLEYTVKGISNKNEKKIDKEVSEDKKESNKIKSKQDADFLFNIIDGIPGKNLLKFEEDFKYFLNQYLQKEEENRLKLTSFFSLIQKKSIDEKVAHRKINKEQLKKHLTAYFFKNTNKLSSEQLSSLRENIVAEFSHIPEVMSYGK